MVMHSKGQRRPEGQEQRKPRDAFRERMHGTRNPSVEFITNLRKVQMTARELDAAGRRKEATFLQSFSISPSQEPIKTKGDAEFLKDCEACIGDLRP
jgi:hypothetical protein